MQNPTICDDILRRLAVGGLMVFCAFCCIQAKPPPGWEGCYGNFPADIVTSPPPGRYFEPVAVKISTEFLGSEIRYTLDGSCPQRTSNLISTNEQFFLTNTALLTFRMWIPNIPEAESGPVQATYVIQPKVIFIEPASGSVITNDTLITIRTTLSDGQIKFSLGGPEYNYNGPFPFSGREVQTILDPLGNPYQMFTGGILTARVVVNGVTIDQDGAVYDRAVLKQPRLDPAPGEIAYGSKLSLFSDDNAEIFFSTNGPATNGIFIKYTEPITIGTNLQLNISLQKPGYDSWEGSAGYVLPQLPRPNFFPPSGPLTNVSPITIVSPVEGAEIRYTLDGTEPNPQSRIYADPLPIWPGTIVKAKLYKPGMNPSFARRVQYHPAPLPQPQCMLKDEWPSLKVTFAGWFDRPVWLGNAGDKSSRLFVGQQSGIVWILGKPTPFLTLGEQGPNLSLVQTNRAPSDGGISVIHEGGIPSPTPPEFYHLISLAFPPDFEISGEFYVSYIFSDPFPLLHVSRYTAHENPDRADVGSGQVIAKFQPPTCSSAGRLFFNEQGRLCINAGNPAIQPRWKEGAEPILVESASPIKGGGDFMTNQNCALTGILPSLNASCRLRSTILLFKPGTRGILGLSLPDVSQNPRILADPLLTFEPGFGIYRLNISDFGMDDSGKLYAAHYGSTIFAQDAQARPISYLGGGSIYLIEDDPAPFNLEIKSISATEINLAWNVPVGVVYQLESSIDLRSWTSLGPRRDGTSIGLSIALPKRDQEYFRVRLISPGDPL